MFGGPGRHAQRLEFYSVCWRESRIFWAPIIVAVLESCLWRTEELEVRDAGGSQSTFKNSVVGEWVPLLSASQKVS